MAARGDDERFDNVEEQVSAILRFGDEQAGHVHRRIRRRRDRVLRDRGRQGHAARRSGVRVRRRARARAHRRRQEAEAQKFKSRDQIAPEIEYFSDCILNDVEPEPSGIEGLADVRVIRAIYRSIDEGRPVRLDQLDKSARPSMAQERSAPPVRGEPPKVNVRPET